MERNQRQLELAYDLLTKGEVARCLDILHKIGEEEHVGIVQSYIGYIRSGSIEGYKDTEESIKSYKIAQEHGIVSAAKNLTIIFYQNERYSEAFEQAKKVRDIDAEGAFLYYKSGKMAGIDTADLDQYLQISVNSKLIHALDEQFYLRLMSNKFSDNVLAILSMPVLLARKYRYKRGKKGLR